MKHPRLFTLVLAIALFCVGLTFTASAQTPTTPPVAATPSAPDLPSTPASPTVPPTTPAPAARREETAIDAPVPSSNDTGVVEKRPSIYQRAAAYLQNRESLAAEISARDRTIADLRAQLTEATLAISARDTELTELRAGRDHLQAAVSKLENERRDVTHTLASLGFEQSQLPAAAQLDQVAENSVEGLQLKLKSETDDVKRSEIMTRIIELRDAKK
jgi:hypothetical protein